MPKRWFFPGCWAQQSAAVSSGHLFCARSLSPCPIPPLASRGGDRWGPVISIICPRCLSFQASKGISSKCHFFSFCRQSENLSVMGICQPLIIKVGPIEKKARGSETCRHRTGCHVVALLKTVFSRALGTCWNLGYGHDADQKGNVWGREGATHISKSLCREVCPATVSPHPGSRREWGEPPLEKYAGTLVSPVLG